MEKLYDLNLSLHLSVNSMDIKIHIDISFDYFIISSINCYHFFTFENSNLNSQLDSLYQDNAKPPLDYCVISIHLVKNKGKFRNHLLLPFTFAVECFQVRPLVNSFSMTSMQKVSLVTVNQAME